MNLAEAMNRWGGIEGAGKHKMGGDFVELVAEWRVDVNVHAVHGALLKGSKCFAPGPWGVGFMPKALVILI